VLWFKEAGPTHERNGMTDLNAGRVSATIIPVLVVVLGFSSNFLARGVVDSYLVFMQPLEAEFGWRHGELTQVYSVYLITLGLMSPFTGMIIDHWGPKVSYVAGAICIAAAMFIAGRASEIWQLHVSIGVLCGTGSSLVGMVPAAALIGRWFDRNMSIAIAIAYSGFGSGMLAVVPLTQASIDHYGWRETYTILFWCVAALVPVLLLLPWRIIAKGAQGNPRVRIKSVDGTPPEPEWTVRNAIGTLEFWLLVQVFFFTALAAYLTTVQTIAFLIDRGYPALDAAFAFGVAGMLSIFGVLMSGWASQRFGILRSTLVSYAGTLIGIIALFAFSIWPHGVLVLIFVLGFGTSQGARGPVISSLNARIFAHGRVSSIYGLIFMLMSFGAATGSWLSGRLYEWTNDYSAAFVVAALAILLAGAPFVFTRRLTQATEMPPPVI